MKTYALKIRDNNLDGKRIAEFELIGEWNINTIKEYNIRKGVLNKSVLEDGRGIVLCVGAVNLVPNEKQRRIYVVKFPHNIKPDVLSKSPRKAKDLFIQDYLKDNLVAISYHFRRNKLARSK